MIGRTEADVSIVDIDRIHKLTVDQVLQMVEQGILAGDEPVELLEGVLVAMSPQGPRHAYSIGRLVLRLQKEYEHGAIVREEKPLRTSETSLPEPDVAVVRGDWERFVDRHPAGSEALLVVEVALTSQPLDRRKAAIYAQGGVPVYWMLDVAGRRLVVCEHPTGAEYGLVRILAEDDEVDLPERPTRWRVASLLP